MSAALAWLIATELLGHPTPFFAPVAAIITLGITVGQRGQRAAEVALGVALGIAVADLLVLQIGTGAAQLAVVVLLATSAAIFLGSGQMLATQAAVSAALVATLQPPTDGFSFERFLDALVGGGVALTINALVLPARPLDLMRRASAPLLEELAEVLEDVAVAVERRDGERAVAALERARGIDELGARFEEAVDVSRETTRYAPPRRRARGIGGELRRRGGADRPRRPQRAGARARHDPGALARRERPAGDRRRAARPRRRRARAGGARSTTRTPSRPSASRPSAPPPGRPTCSRPRATCR